MPSGTLSLKQCAEVLGVHYMTAYRYVRLGMLPAHKAGPEWRVQSSDLDRFRAEHSGRGRPGGRSHRDAPWAERLLARLTAGDERGSWQVIEAALSSGLEPAEIYTDVLSPALRAIGEQWAAGESSIVVEHRATAIATRIIGRLSGRFTHPGRHRGRVVIGTPAGESHALPAAMVADMLRGAGFEVVDLGVDLPAEEFVAAVEMSAPVTAVAVSIVTSDSVPEARRLIAALRDSSDAPIVVGGGGVANEAEAKDLGADGYAADGPAAVEFATSRLAG